MTLTGKRRLLTRLELAEAMGVGPGTIRAWQRQGLPVAVYGTPGSKASPNLYDPEAVREWRRARDAKRQDATRSRAEREHWHAKLAEQTYKARERELLPRAEVERERARLEADIRAKLGAMAARYSPRLVSAIKEGGLPALERALGEVAREVLLELAGASAPRKGRKR